MGGEWDNGISLDALEEEHVSKRGRGDFSESVISGWQDSNWVMSPDMGLMGRVRGVSSLHRA